MIKHIVIVLRDEVNAHANYNPWIVYACTNANNVDTRLYQSIYTHTRRSKIVFRYIFLDDISIEMSSQSYLVDVKCKKKRGREREVSFLYKC